jgi:hypothetical protein
VECVGDAVAVEPRTRLLHGVAVLDAVDRDRLSGGQRNYSGCRRRTVRGGLFYDSARPAGRDAAAEDSRPGLARRGQDN